MAQSRQGAPRAGYRRAAGSARGEARREELLARVTDDLAANGLVGFSLRRAARAAGTTHKVLLYYFDGPDDLMRQAVLRLRERRIANAVDAASALPAGARLSDRVLALWPVLVDAASGARVLDQAVGLAMFDPERYGELAREATEQYLPALVSLCPSRWAQQRKEEVATLVLAALRGLLVDRLVTGADAGVAAGLEALARAVDREERARE